jgi:branched-chain amino acid transport system ATP-binding protein
VLRLENVQVYYGESHILKGVTFEIAAGDSGALLGRNGAGKTTTLRAVMGLAPPCNGKICLNGVDITRLRPHRVALLGVGYVPEERAVFPSLSVQENLTLPARKTRPGLWDLEKIYDCFPVLRQRLKHSGAQLSGGEQQMLAIARVLTMPLKLLLLDEPTEGLAPFLVREIARIIQEIRSEGITTLLVEQNIRFAVQAAHCHHVLYEGKIAYTGDSEDLNRNHEVQKRYLGV